MLRPKAFWGLPRSSGYRRSFRSTSGKSQRSISWRTDSGTILRQDLLFEGLGKEIPVGRYHSWVVSREGFPDCLEITAESQEGQIMAIRHKTYNVHGIQFHPESVLTPQGKEIIKNFLND